MPSAQDCAARLREQAYRTLIPQIRELEQELQGVTEAFKAGFEQISRKIESIRHIELPTSELILGEILEEVVRQKDIDNKALLLFMRGLAQKETQEEILSFLLDGAHRFCPRVALFAVRGGRFIGWSSRGFSEELSRAIGDCLFPCSEYPQLQAAFDKEDQTSVAEFGQDSPLSFLRGDVAGSWNIVPLRAMQKPVALLLTSGESINSEATLIMAGLVGLRLENIALRILRAIAMARSESAASRKIEKEPAVPAPEPEPEPPPPVAAPETAVEEPAAAPQPVEEPARENEAALDLESIQRLARDAEAVKIDDGVEMPPAAEEPLETQDAVPLPEAMISQPPEANAVPDEEMLHLDAKRFARLVVTEIKLYNEHHVVEGRANRDLYLRLKRDIDRSREMYEKRVSPVVSQKIDYFHDEIIRILGDNDPSTLGSDYPGPRVES
jgi:hypothetical protein